MTVPARTPLIIRRRATALSFVSAISARRIAAASAITVPNTGPRDPMDSRVGTNAARRGNVSHHFHWPVANRTTEAMIPAPSVYARPRCSRQTQSLCI